MLSHGLLCAVAVALARGAVRNVDLVADEANNVHKMTRCECDFGDNYWLALLTELWSRDRRDRREAESLVGCPVAFCIFL